MSAAAEKPMNVIFILADDLGWSDTELYGTTKFYNTPNISRLAERGMLFSRAYANSPLCSPTRASILTGQTPLRHGSTAPNHHIRGEEHLRAKETPTAAPFQKSTAPRPANRLDTSWPTLAKLIKAKGYATGHFGKWHLGHEPYSPLEHGFDMDIPHHAGPGPHKFYVGDWTYPNLKARHPKENIEDRMAEEAVKWMKTVKDKPFYMSYWAFSVHGPWDGHEHLVERYKKTLDENDEQRAPTYAAMVHTFDDAVGTLLDAVDELGIADHTAFVFTSDNGGNMYNTIDGGVPPTSNRPLRGGKATEWDGGVRVPCAVVWPGVTGKGTSSDQVIQSCDFYPTILNLLDIPLPEQWPVDGADITPALKGGSLDRDGIFIYFPHATVGVPDWLPPSIEVVSGDWKLIRLFYHGADGGDELILSNFEDDIGEAENLASKYPEKTLQLNQVIDDYLQSVEEKALPLRNPNFQIKKYVPENRGVPKVQWKAPVGGVEGFEEGGTAVLEKTKGYALLESTGKDPYLIGTQIHKKRPLRGGPFKVSFGMKSNSEGPGQLFYQSPFNKKQSVEFDVKHDGVMHEVVVAVPAKAMSGFRIDPGTATGRFEFTYIRIEDAAGKIAKEWAFATEPSGDAQISAPFGGSKIVIKTTTRLAGAIDSLTWNGMEFIDSHDHGRQLQSASAFYNGGPDGKSEGFNPTEAGSSFDGKGPTSTSKLLAVEAKGNVLKTRSQMAFWLRPGQKSKFGVARNTKALSDHLFEKTVTIGAMGMPNVIRYETTFIVPNHERHTKARFETVTAYLPPEFSLIQHLDRVTGKLELLDSGPKEQKDPVVVSTPDGRHAMGIITANLPAPLVGPTYGYRHYEKAKVVKWNSVYRVADKGGIKTGPYSYVSYIPIGTREMVRTALIDLDKQLRRKDEEESAK